MAKTKKKGSRAKRATATNAEAKRLGTGNHTTAAPVGALETNWYDVEYQDPILADPASWAPDAMSPDFRHLGLPGMTGWFDLTASAVKSLLDVNAFALPATQRLVLFGLRGCMVDPTQARSFRKAVALTEQIPDHRTARCVLGVWNRDTGELAAFQGSTVPNEHYMRLQRNAGRPWEESGAIGQVPRNCNMLVTGRHAYEVGDHRDTIKGVFALRDVTTVVLRSNRNLTYETTDRWDICIPGDNIHPSFVGESGAAFSSAGCHTVPGRAAGVTHSGEWAEYRKIAGLKAKYDEATEKGRQFTFVLLTGREARLAVQGGGPVRRLRLGSSGDAVRKLQQALRKAGLLTAPPDGEMGPNTVNAYVRWQQNTNNGEADGIVTAEAATSLGFELSAGAPPLDVVAPVEVTVGVKAKADPALQRRLTAARAHDVIDVNIFLRGEPGQLAELESPQKVGDSPQRSIVESLQQRTEAEQAPFLEWLGEGAKAMDAELPSAATESFWLTNAVAARVSAQRLAEILRRPDVAYVELARNVPLEELIDANLRGRSNTARRGRDARLADSPAIDAPPVAWSVEKINAPQLWQKGLRGEGILVAVIDSGINYEHPDLRGRMWSGGTDYPKHGYDFDSDDTDPRDEEGHGTACAGIVAGDGSSGRATGVAPGAQILAIRVGGSERKFWRGMQFAIEQGAHVISMSMTWKYPNRPNYPGWRRACETILAAGVLHANSTGNQGADLSSFPVPFNIGAPGNCPPPWMHPEQAPAGQLSSAISCGATDDTDQLASYSGRGPAAWEQEPYTDYPYEQGARGGLLKPDLCAPGPGTSSCDYRYIGTPGTKPYSSFSGTSAATPHIAGCLALLAQACQRSNEPIVQSRIQEAMEQTAVRIFGQTRAKEIHFGAGRVDVHAAFQYGVDRGWWS
jgi:subtilisin family serine protease